jgi:hypothetical protein
VQFAPPFLSLTLIGAIMLTWKIYKSGYKWVVEWSDGIKTVFMSEKSALQAVNNRFFDTYF